MAQPWPLVSVLSKPALCEGQDSTRVTIHRTFQSTHQGLGSRGPKAGGTGRDRKRRNVLRSAPGTSPPWEGGCGGLPGT